ncbi:CoA synthetase [Albimonas sp. CAU 1670]|uniref:CoA-transferase n=1 Tax=Albimonas sp. CAU 1670 TaxID=3032599 RepID=UPI0023DB7D36|nr:CoA-transferase [Albimonas sp. CAU 1670]MDF2234868.1 CoA synthetase [Albimonas sp. CAU 1670]
MSGAADMAAAMGDVKREELLISVISELLAGARHVAVGALSPIPGAGALLGASRSGGRVTIIGSDLPAHRMDGGVELFDMAAQGRVDGFFLSGGQIDGQANINLTGAGDYPRGDVRWSGAFGSAFLYFQVPKVILFREEHTRRVFVPKVDFISAPGASEPGVFRPGGAHALVTGLCVMSFDRQRVRFTLKSVHPGVTVEEVRDNTGFDFDVPESVPVTDLPSAETLATIRTEIAAKIANPYPEFAERVFGVPRDAAA